MLRGYRRLWALLIVAILAMPAVVLLLAADRQTVSAEEARILAPAPGWPNGAAAWLALPGRADAYLSDHFGMRRLLIHAYAVLTQLVLRDGNDHVLIGRRGGLFVRDDEALLQSAGLTRRPALVADTVEVLTRINRAASAAGIRLIAGFPPNSETMTPELLPAWARNPGRQTEYDMLLAALRTRGIAVVDMRPPLRAAAAGGKTYYRHDTHWTARGAIAGFNAVAGADGHADWRIDAATALGPATVHRDGDLARLLGIGDDVSEPDRRLNLPDGPRRPLGPAPAPTEDPGIGSGPTILIIGDSFTESEFPLMLRQHAGTVWWMPEERCRVDWRWVERLHPDEIWWLPNERFMLCLPGQRPIGLE